VEEEEEEDQIGTSDEELEEDVFRKRKAELTSHAGRLPCRMNSNVFLFKGAGHEIQCPWIKARVAAPPTSTG